MVNTLTVADAMTAHILIVEDEAILAKNIERYLRRQGFATTVVDTINSAITEVRLGSVDALLLDVELPDGNGLEAYPQLCQLAPLPAIAMTGCPRAEYRQRARELQLDGFLLKPFPLAQLAENLRALSRGSKRACDSKSTDEKVLPVDQTVSGLISMKTVLN